MKKDSAIPTIKQPNSIQQLFTYLTKHNQDRIRPILGVLKVEVQMTLCTRLLDYMETGTLRFNGNLVMDSVAIFVTGWNSPENHDPIICPLTGEICPECADAITPNTQFDNQ